MSISHTGAVNAVALSPDGQYIISGSDDTTVRAWTTAADNDCLDTLTGHTGGTGGRSIKVRKK